MNILFYLIFALGISIMQTKTAHAYLDPGSGSLLFQLLIGGLLSGLFAIKLYFKKIKAFFTKKNADQQTTEKTK